MTSPDGATRSMSGHRRGEVFTQLINLKRGSQIRLPIPLYLVCFCLVVVGSGGKTLPRRERVPQLSVRVKLSLSVGTSAPAALWDERTR